jgi:tetratricopeptide (TPR) repeat protein
VTALRLVVVLLLVVAAPVGAGLLRDGDSERGLEPVPTPDTSRLSEAVRITLTSVDSEFDRIAPQLDAEALGVAYGRLAMRYQSHQLDGAVAPAYRNAIRLDPDEFRWQYFLGFHFQEAGEFLAASSSYDRANDLAPGFAQARLRSALALLDADSTEQAHQRLQRYDATHPDDPAALAALANIAAGRGDHDDAVRLYRRAIELAPYADQLYYPLALSLRRTGDPSAATAAMALRGEGTPALLDPELSSMQLLSRPWSFFLTRGQEAASGGRVDEAALMLQTAVDVYPDSVAARIALAQSLVTEQNYADAIPHLERVLTLATDSVHALVMRGSIAELNGDDEQALALFERWLELDGGAASHRRAGDVALRLGEYARAQTIFRAAMTASGPAVPWARSKLAVALLATGDCDDALALLEDQRDPESLMWRSRALATCSDRSEDERRAALAMADALVERYPNQATYVTRALALSGIGQHAAAADLVRRILFEGLRTGDQPPEIELLNEVLPQFEGGVPASRATTPAGPYLSPRIAAPGAARSET